MRRALCTGLVAASLLAGSAAANGPDAPVSPPLTPAHLVALEVFPRFATAPEGAGREGREEFEGGEERAVREDGFAAALERAFVLWDEDGDGRLSPLEAPLFELVAVSDRNGDGAIAPREFAGAMWRLFRTLDGNGDGVVSRAEWHARTAEPGRSTGSAAPARR